MRTATSRASRRRIAHASIEERARPTPERLRRAARNFERDDTGGITMRDSPLERVLVRKIITPDQYAAAQKYRHHWYHSGLCDPLASVDITRVFSGDKSSFSGMPLSESQAFHRQCYRQAGDAIGPIGSHVLEHAVCREIPLDQVGLALGWNNAQYAHAAAAERMKVALDQLCAIWGIGNLERGLRLGH